jgi:hypothetical protein
LSALVIKKPNGGFFRADRDGGILVISVLKHLAHIRHIFGPCPNEFIGNHFPQQDRPFWDRPPTLL